MQNCMSSTDDSLDHVDTIIPHATDTSVHIDAALGLGLIQKIVQRNERASPTNSSAAVDHSRTGHTVKSAAELPVKCQQRRRVEWDAVVRPCCKVKLLNC